MCNFCRCNFCRCKSQGFETQSVNRPRPISLPQMLRVAGDKPVLFERLQVIGQSPNGNPAFTSQTLLRGPAAEVFIRPVRKSHENKLAAAGQARVPGIENSGNVLDAHAGVTFMCGPGFG
jgi:hypothetical protein